VVTAVRWGGRSIREIQHRTQAALRLQLFAQQIHCVYTEHSFLFRPTARKNQRKHTPLISNSSDEDIRYFAIIRRRLTSTDALPPFKTFGIAPVFHCLNESSVAHHPPML
jgi:hypothetical protein